MEKIYKLWEILVSSSAPLLLASYFHPLSLNAHFAISEKVVLNEVAAVSSSLTPPLLRTYSKRLQISQI